MAKTRSDERALRGEALDELRCFKILAYLQYRHHALMARGLGMPGARAVFDRHARQALEEADRLAARICDLDAIPVFAPGAIGDIVAAERLHAKSAPTLRGMALENLTLERRQIRMYQSLIRLLAFEDPVSRALLEDILQTTEAQAHRMFQLLRRTAPTEAPTIQTGGTPTPRVLSYLDLREALVEAVGT